MEEKIEKTKLTLGGVEIPTLTPDQIDCRVGQSGTDWFTILLYKDARVDMSILDALVGPENWQRDHKEIKGNLYCGVGIRVADSFVWKWDCGTESNTEKEKGEASDSFKRACVNWGIGRELYTAPRISLNAEPQDKNKQGKLYPDIRVTDIGYNDKREIVRLVLADKTGKTRFTFGTPARKPAPAPVTAPTPAPAPAKKADGLKKGQIITREMVESGKCDALIGKLREFVGTSELKKKASEVQSYYKWDSIETYNAICEKAQSKKLNGLVDQYAEAMLKS